MQRHERDALAAARELLGPGVTFQCQRRNPHGRLIYGRHYLSLSSSPRDRDTCPNLARQWARRVLKET